MTMEQDDPSMDAAMRNSKVIGRFEDTIKVEYNKESGKIEGWDSLFAFVEEEKKIEVTG